MNGNDRIFTCVWCDKKISKKEAWTYCPWTKLAGCNECGKLPGTMDLLWSKYGLTAEFFRSKEGQISIQYEFNLF